MNAPVSAEQCVRWFHFWNPSSGLPGGLIMGCILTAPFYLLMWWLT